MGRNKAAFTGHTELRKTFERKGMFKKHASGGEVRMYIKYTQLEHKEGYGYIYMLDYDGHIFYQIFKERFIENDEGATIANYPNDNAFVENDWQWAWVSNSLEDAKEILNSFECIY